MAHRVPSRSFSGFPTAPATFPLRSTACSDQTDGSPSQANPRTTDDAHHTLSVSPDPESLPETPLTTRFDSCVPPGLFYCTGLQGKYSTGPRPQTRLSLHLTVFTINPDSPHIPLLESSDPSTPSTSFRYLLTVQPLTHDPGS